MDNPLPRRIGTFFILLGCILLILFALSMFSKGYNCLYFLLGAVSMFMGISLRRRPVTPSAPSMRFGTIQKIQERRRKRREGEQQKKNQKKR